MTPKIQFSPPPHNLKKKVRGNLRIPDLEAIERAPKALDNMQEEFESWICNDLGELADLFATIISDGCASKTLKPLAIKAHDLKGIGATFNYPLVSRIAKSLLAVLSIPETPEETPIPLIEMHIKALRAIVAHNVKTSDDPTGLAMAEELEKRVDEYFDEQETRD